jgi:hypothetical protein
VAAVAVVGNVVHQVQDQLLTVYLVNLEDQAEELMHQE